MKPIAVFYHCYLFDGQPPHVHQPALNIVREQMLALTQSKLGQSASHICVGVNGGMESWKILLALVPKKSKIVCHGLHSKNENPTIVEIEKWVPSHLGWLVLYFHCKGASHPPGSAVARRAASWRKCMMDHLVLGWPQCVKDLEDGMESVGVHWIRGLDETQNYWAGNFWWASSDYLATLPSIYRRLAIKTYGLETYKSRYEAEVWIGNGPKLPLRKDYHPQHITIAH